MIRSQMTLPVRELLVALLIIVSAGATQADEEWEQHRKRLRKVSSERLARENSLYDELTSAIRRNDASLFAVHAELLGVMRSTNPHVIRQLISRVDWDSELFDPGHTGDNPVRALEYMPAAIALSKIGNRASPLLVRSLEYQHDPQTLRIVAGVLVNCEASYLREVDGAARLTALCRLNARLRGIDQVDKPFSAERLNEAITFVPGYMGEPFGRYADVPRFAIQYDLKPAIAGRQYASKVPVLPPISDFGETMRIEFRDSSHDKDTTLPPGLALGDDGWIRGVASTPGDYICVFRARRSAESQREERNSREFRIRVMRNE